LTLKTRSSAPPFAAGWTDAPEVTLGPCGTEVSTAIAARQSEAPAALGHASKAQAVVRAQAVATSPEAPLSSYRTNRFLPHRFAS
jgi:hypothetical protein